MSDRLLQTAKLRLVMSVVGSYVTFPVALSMRRRAIFEEVAGDATPLAEVGLAPRSDPYLGTLLQHRLAIVKWSKSLPGQVLFTTMGGEDQPIRVFFQPGETLPVKAPPDNLRID